MNKKFALIILCMFIFLCACNRHAEKTEQTPMTKAEMLDLSFVLTPDRIEKPLNNLTTAKKVFGPIRIWDTVASYLSRDLIGNVYTFNGIVHSVESDHAVVRFSLKDNIRLLEPKIETIAANVYLPPEELAIILPMQKVTFVGCVDEVTANTENAIRLNMYCAAIVKDCFKHTGKLIEPASDHASNTWKVKLLGIDEPVAVTFVYAMDFYQGKDITFLFKTINGNNVNAWLLDEAGDVVQTTPTTEYDPILHNWPDIMKLQHPNLSQAEIRTMIETQMTLDEVAEKIDTLADLIQYLYQRGYTFGNKDLNLWYGGYEWAANRSARQVFVDNMGNCGGGSHLVNYILRNDFDEQGYFRYAFNVGGHVTNYFKQDGIYYFFDLSMISNHGYTNEWGDVLFSTDNPEEYANSIARNCNAYYSPYDPSYVLLLWMYPHEGDSIPVGINKNARTRMGGSFFNILPKQYENNINILYLDEGMPAPIFIEAPEKHLWPIEAQ